MNRRIPIVELRYEHFSFLLQFAQELHNKHGEPIPDIGEEGIDKVKSCLVTPFQTFDNRALYKTFNKKATALFYFLIKNHCLQNGNKRMAILSLSFFISLNRRSFRISDDCLYALAKQTAMRQNKEKSLSAISKILRRNVRRRSLRKAATDGYFSTERRVREKGRMRRITRSVKGGIFIESLRY